jgi:hypothetical protein
MQIEGLPYAAKSGINSFQGFCGYFRGFNKTGFHSVCATLNPGSTVLTLKFCGIGQTGDTSVTLADLVGGSQCFDFSFSYETD